MYYPNYSNAYYNNNHNTQSNYNYDIRTPDYGSIVRVPPLPQQSNAMGGAFGAGNYGAGGFGGYGALFLLPFIGLNNSGF